MRSTPFLVACFICQLRPVASAESSPVVQLPGGIDLEVDAPQGYCLKTIGPWREKPQISAAAERLGAWTDREQILCLADLDLPEASFKVSPTPKPQLGNDGQFGFGPKVGVNLRPRISTSALWPLQADTPTLGISFKDQAARVVALQATLNNQVVLEMPMVAARFRHQWAIDVHAMNDTTSCQAEGVVGASRIACRFDTASSLVQLVVFCRPCALRNARMQITAGGRHQETSEPWIGLSSPGESQWVIVVTDLIDGQEKVHEFVVAAVRGREGTVHWKESSSQRYTRLIGTALLQVTFFVAVALLLLPEPACAAARSSLAAAALAVPYLAQLAQLEDAPILLKSAFASWPFSGAEEGWRSIGEVMAVLLGVIVLHGCAAMLFLRENGPGSAEMMPHGLSFGAWELRGAGYVALPLAAAASRVASGAAGSFFQLFCSGLALAILIGLFVLPWKVLQTLRSWFQEGRVVCLQHPADGQTQYVDRVCDQLSAIPPRRRSRLLGSWLEASSWQSTAAVAMIQEVEHHGTCKERGGEHWDRHWSAGPWQPLLPHQSSTGSAPTPISEGLRHRPVSVDSSEPLIKSGWKSPKAIAAPSALLTAHPVTVTTRFCFAQSRGFAGVCGLPWLDAAVPAAEMPSLERRCSVQMQLRVQARQLSGPFTSGSLSACFDSANRKPWWWSYDFFLKVLAGCLVSEVAEASTERHLLRIAWLGLMMLLALWVLYTRPHVHVIENLVAISAAGALPGGTAFYLYGNELVEHRQKAVLALLVFGYLPSLVALVVCLYSYKITKDQDLPENVIGWGELSGNRLGYERLSLEEDDSQNVNVGRDIDLYSADAVLIASEGSKAPRIRIPCEVKLPLRPVHVWMKGAIAVSSSLTDRQTQVAVPAELLLGHTSSPENPWATVLTPDGGLLLYRDQETNGGLKWQQVLGHFLRGCDAAVLREAERLLSEERPDSLTALEILEG